VVGPDGGLPQAARKLDNDFSRLFEGELLLSVDTLSIDAASFRQMATVTTSGGATIADQITRTVTDRGKQHNPVTESGGMFVGAVLQATPSRTDAKSLIVGTRIASLVSLSLTPLIIRAISAVREGSAQVDVIGEAVLFSTGPYAVLPADLSERVVLAALDVAGAAPQVARWVKPDSITIILGAGGKSGILCCTEARRRAGAKGVVVGVEFDESAANDVERLDLCDVVVRGDARDAATCMDMVLRATKGKRGDAVFSCVNVANAEMTAILLTRPRGLAYFFAMSTSFTKAALGAEGVGADIDLMIGNGFATDHAAHTLDLLRGNEHLLKLFERRYGAT